MYWTNLNNLIHDKKFSIITYGCRHNRSDSERLAWEYTQEGFELTDDIELSDLILVNCCSIKSPAIEKYISTIKNLQSLREKGTKIVIAGCLLSEDKERIREYVDEIKNFPSSNNGAIKLFPKLSGCVPIMTGCNNFCSYCIVPYTRGSKIISRNPESIIQDVKYRYQQGVKYLTLTGPNVNMYQGNNKGEIVDFPDLISTIDDLDEDFKFDFMHPHPKYVSDKMIENIGQSNKFTRKIHLPIQSANNKILKEMNRGYTVEQYEKLYEKVREKGIKVTTDIIVGFPGETEEIFNEYINFFERLEFENVFIHIYYPMPYTKSKSLKDDVPMKEKLRRKEILKDKSNICDGAYNTVTQETWGNNQKVVQIN